jgi:hypothetical protein
VSDLAVIDLTCGVRPHERKAFEQLGADGKPLVENLTVIVRLLNNKVGGDWSGALAAALKQAVAAADPTWKLYEWNVEAIATDVVKAMVADRNEEDDPAAFDPDIEDYLRDDYHSIASRASGTETEVVMARVRERVEELWEDHDGSA